MDDVHLVHSVHITKEKSGKPIMIARCQESYSDGLAAFLEACMDEMDVVDYGED